MNIWDDGELFKNLKKQLEELEINKFKAVLSQKDLKDFYINFFCNDFKAKTISKLNHNELVEYLIDNMSVDEIMGFNAEYKVYKNNKGK